MRHKVISFLKCIQILFGNNLTGEGIKYLAKAQGRKGFGDFGCNCCSCCNGWVVRFSSYQVVKFSDSVNLRYEGSLVSRYLGLNFGFVEEKESRKGAGTQRKNPKPINRN